MSTLTTIESGPSRSRSIVQAVLSILVTILAVGAISGPAQASNTNNVCDFGVFIGVRGTSAPAGTNSAHSGRVWRSGGFSDELNTMKNQVTSSAIPYYIASLNYPAAGGLDYFSSVETGRKTLVNELNYIAEQCVNYLPAILLSGHSQGAAVIATALADNGSAPHLTAKAKASIRAVTFFGDPNFRQGHDINAPVHPVGSAGSSANTTPATPPLCWRTRSGAGLPARARGCRG